MHILTKCLNSHYISIDNKLTLKIHSETYESPKYACV